MKKIFITLLIATVLVACNDSKQKDIEVATETIASNYDFYGEKITDKDVLSAEEMMVKYNSLKPGDTIDVKFKAKVNEVCQAKGCWMKLDLENGNQVMVKFKDYGFFMPKNIAGEEVIINGKAFVNEVPVEELRHYAEDAGKSAEEIAAITESKKTYSFEADGVLLIQ